MSSLAQGCAHFNGTDSACEQILRSYWIVYRYFVKVINRREAREIKVELAANKHTHDEMAVRFVECNEVALYSLCGCTRLLLLHVSSASSDKGYAELCWPAGLRR